MKVSTTEGIILATLALGFVRDPGTTQPTHYRMTDVSGPLQMRWPDGKWYEVSVKEIEAPENIERTEI